jgi:hypothetical protein
MPTTASHGVVASTDPRSTATPISAPSRTTANRPRLRGASGTTAAGITPTAAATPVLRSIGKTAAAGTA